MIQLSGNISDVKRQIEEYVIPADMQLQVTIIKKNEISHQEDENAAMFRHYEAEFADAPRVNGIIVLPYTQGDDPLTMERIKELSED